MKVSKMCSCSVYSKRKSSKRKVMKRKSTKIKVMKGGQIEDNIIWDFTPIYNHYENPSRDIEDFVKLPTGSFYIQVNEEKNNDPDATNKILNIVYEEQVTTGFNNNNNKTTINNKYIKPFPIYQRDKDFYIKDNDTEFSGESILELINSLSSKLEIQLIAPKVNTIARTMGKIIREPEINKEFKNTIQILKNYKEKI